MEKAEKLKYVLRLPPCPDYDVEGTECWLTDLAREGLLLKKDGLFAGVAVFERAVPQRVQYRLEAAQKDTSLLGDGYEPDPEQVELCAQYGWEYVARRGEFYIYRSHDPAARELNTDPAVQALALKAVKSRSVSAAIYAALWILVFLLAPILKRVGLLRAILELRTPVFSLRRWLSGPSSAPCGSCALCGSFKGRWSRAVSRSAGAAGGGTPSAAMSSALSGWV